MTYEIPLPMDEYNDPDTVRLGGQFFSKSRSNSFQRENAGQRTMSLCIDRNPIAKTNVTRNISSPPAMPGTSQKRFSFRLALNRGGSKKTRNDSVRSNAQSPGEGTILEEGKEGIPQKDLSDPNGTDESAGKRKLRVHEGRDSFSEPRNDEKTPNQLHFWWFYFKRCGWALVFFFCLSSCFYQSLKMYSDMRLNDVVDGKEDLIQVGR